MRDKCCSEIVICKAVSFLAFNPDFNTQEAFIEIDENLFLFFVFKSDKSENILSGSAFECGSDLIAFRSDLKCGYLILLLDLRFKISFHMLSKSSFAKLCFSSVETSECNVSLFL